MIDADRRPLRPLALALLALAAGCAGDGSSWYGTPEHASSETAAGTDDAAAPAPPSFESLPLDEYYIVNQEAAVALGSRIDWQTATGALDARRLVIEGDAILTLDGRNFLTRFRRDDGSRAWRPTSVAAPITEILGVTYVPDAERVYLTFGGDLAVLDAGSGVLIDKQEFEKIANTSPAVYGQFLVYGARAGEVIWHSYAVGFRWRAFTVAQTIEIPPVVHGRSVAVVGTGGRIMVLAANSARRRWDRTLLDEVVCAPAVTDAAVYVAGTDQHLWAYELGSGRILWRVLTESRLVDSPVVVGERLYQSIPGEGLACFEALPIDAPGGARLWTASDVTGSVITTRGDHVIAWDAARRRATVLTAARGSVVEAVDLPDVERLVADGLVDGDLFALAADGRLERLVARR